MRRHLLFLLFFTNLSLLYPFQLLAEENPSFEISLIARMRTDELQWSIAGGGNTHGNILSELEFKDIEIYQYGIGTTLSINNFFVASEITKGNIYNGRATDTDYTEDNRNVMTFKSEMDLKRDDIREISVAIGYHYKFLGTNFSLDPFVGYSKKTQDLLMTNGRLLFPQDRPIYDLNSKYATNWESFFGGIESAYSFYRISIHSFFKYHFLDYDAVADWNLRTDLASPVSFRHFGDGHGYEAGFGISYLISNWRIGLTCNYARFKIEDGRDELYFSSGPMVKSRLNEAKWQSKSLNFKISYVFDLPSKTGKE